MGDLPFDNILLTHFTKHLSPTLATERLNLTLLRCDHAQAMLDFAARNREHLAPWEPTWPEEYFTLDYWTRAGDDAESEFFAGVSLRLILLDNTAASHHVLGTANFRSILRGASQSCTLGYSLAETSQGKGLMHEALEAAIPYVFESLAMHRISACYIPSNERSGRLLERLGFEKEGYARDFLRINGRWQDHILTAKINPAWRLEETIRI